MKRGHVRLRRRRLMERGEIAETDDGARIAADGVVVDAIENAHSAVAASREEKCIVLVRVQEVVELPEIVETEIQILDQMIVEAVEEQFPPLAEFAREKITSIRQPDVLRLLVKQIYKAPDEATARWLLNTLPSQSDTK